MANANFEFVGQIRSKNQTLKGQEGNEKPAVVVKLKQRSGKEYEWTCFHASEFDDSKLGDFVLVEAYYSPNPRGNYPYKNIKRLIRGASSDELSDPPNPLDSSPASQTEAQPNLTSNASNANSRYSPEVMALERRSIERQKSLEFVMRLVEAGWSLDGIDGDFDRLSRLAEKFESYISRSDALGSPYTNGNLPNTSSQGSTATNGKPPQSSRPADEIDPASFKTIYQLCNAALRVFGKDKDANKICQLMHVENIEELNGKDLVEIWNYLATVWGEPART